MVRQATVKIRVPIEFRDYLYRKKGEDSSKTLGEVCRDLIPKELRKKRKDETFWGKL